MSKILLLAFEGLPWGNVCLAPRALSACPTVTTCHPSVRPGPSIHTAAAHSHSPPELFEFLSFLKQFCPGILPLVDMDLLFLCCLKPISYPPRQGAFSSSPSTPAAGRAPTESDVVLPWATSPPFRTGVSMPALRLRLAILETRSYALAFAPVCDLAPAVMTVHAPHTKTQDGGKYAKRVPVGPVLPASMRPAQQRVACMPVHRGNQTKSGPVVRAP